MSPQFKSHLNTFFFKYFYYPFRFVKEYISATSINTLKFVQLLTDLKIFILNHDFFNLYFNNLVKNSKSQLILPSLSVILFPDDSDFSD